jgi:nucleoside-diphosphate-sugar epimerase
LPGDPDGYLNLIHAADATALLMQVALGAAAATELGAGGTPVTCRVYYRTPASLCGAPPPRFSGEPATRGGGFRRCDPATTCARLQWRPMFSDLRAGLAAFGDELTRE